MRRTSFLVASFCLICLVAVPAWLALAGRDGGRPGDPVRPTAPAPDAGAAKAVVPGAAPDRARRPLEAAGAASAPAAAPAARTGAAPERDPAAVARSIVEAHEHYFDDFLAGMSPEQRAAWFDAPAERLRELDEETRRRLLVREPLDEGASAARALCRCWEELNRGLPGPLRVDLLGLDFLEFDEEDWGGTRDVWKHTVTHWLYHMDEGWADVLNKATTWILLWSPEGEHVGAPADLILVLLQACAHDPSAFTEVVQLLELERPKGDEDVYVFEDDQAMGFIALTLPAALTYEQLQPHFPWLRSVERRGGIQWGYVEMLRDLFTGGRLTADEVLDPYMLPRHVFDCPLRATVVAALELLKTVGPAALPAMEELLLHWRDQLDSGGPEVRLRLEYLLDFAAQMGLDVSVIWSLRGHPELMGAVLSALCRRLPDPEATSRLLEVVHDPDSSPSDQLQAATYLATHVDGSLAGIPEELLVRMVDALAADAAANENVVALTRLSESGSAEVSNRAYRGLLGGVGPYEAIDIAESMSHSPHPRNHEDALFVLGAMVLQARGHAEYERDWNARFEAMVDELVERTPVPSILLPYVGQSVEVAAASVLATIEQSGEVMLEDQ